MGGFRGRRTKAQPSAACIIATAISIRLNELTICHAMNRYHLFYCLHKQLRVSLYETSLTLQRTDFAIDAEAHEADGRVRASLELFQHYQEAFDAHLLPAMMDYEPGVADCLRQERTGLLPFIQKLNAVLTRFHQVSLPAVQMAAGDELTAVFEAFLLFALHYLGKEARLSNPVLWRFYTDVELEQMAAQLFFETMPPATKPFLIIREDQRYPARPGSSTLHKRAKPAKSSRRQSLQEIY